jgi:hypothetical protein
VHVTTEGLQRHTAARRTHLSVLASHLQAQDTRR